MKKCRDCKNTFSVDSFVPRKGRPGKYYSNCIDCYRLECRTKSNDGKTLARKRIFEYFGDRCSLCGKSYSWGSFDCHHVLHEKSNRTPMRLKNTTSLQKELEKCLLLCKNCHRKYHALELENIRTEKRLCELEESNQSSLEKKKCSKCRQDLLLKFFHKGKQAYCKLCQNETNTERFRKFKKQCLTYKKCHECTFCGETDPMVLSFHHMNPLEKDFEISRSKSLVFSKNTEKELEKCVVLCSNCHQSIHYMFS